MRSARHQTSRKPNFMTIDFAEWLNLALRWLHLVTGIAWIGSSFYFVWLDNHLKPPATGDASGELWSVHGGGFYHNQKYQVAPAQMPGDLHWFKWEAYFTWISGFSLLVLIYYFGAESFMLDKAKSNLNASDAIALGLGSLGISWAFYHLLCISPLGRDNRMIGAVWFLHLLAVATLLDGLIADRAVYIHMGAIVGTAMAANVFVVIIPNQRKVVTDLVAGRAPDPKLGQQAKQRSLHNNYMTLPVLFLMISSHYPMTYGAGRPGLVLALIALTGVAVRHSFNLRHKGQKPAWIYGLIAVLAVITITYVAAEKGGSSKTTPAVEQVSYSQVQPILAKHCTSCHSTKPANPAFAAPPLGLALESAEQAGAAAAKIKAQAVDAEIMPLGNLTGMTAEERRILGLWIDAGAPR